ncbi:hypothetical protein [Desulfohalobium retbaense]|uniref:Uncharacterized protein n=1 Tax=Desulfohalobium retbaense (strain ATCC 49708 / DSM 5692 / JCM 16813 / HR100) TaxID=485915 RepID=C8X324_DESRD|nr:hypothetical protein [Desulfohalobium retbaense]ACV68821.1 hypothetical protein Dret_1535 [Desulfohalobium retbaense DSM 5692]
MIEEVVGKKVYGTWIDMLQKLVPEGITHRLAVVIAGMLRYAEIVSHEKQDKSLNARKLAEFFELSYEQIMEDDIEGILSLTEYFLKDANVSYKRFNAKGDEYSIAESAVYEFFSWENMPWKR